MVMTQEEKELLLKDLCARLPYGAKVQRINSFYKWRKEVDDLSDVFLSYNSLVQFKNHIEHLEIKPYLRPMSSMNDEEKKELGIISCEYDPIHKWSIFYKSQDWLNEHHFDYRGLIERGLGIDCTGLNIYENEKST